MSRQKPRPAREASTAAPAATDRPAARALPRLVLAALAAFVIAGAAWFALQPREASRPAATHTADAPAGEALAYAGSAACAQCHAAESEAWRKSQHAVAMQHATAATVLGDFNDASYAFQGVTTTFSQRDGKWFVRTDGPDGKLTDFEVKYTFGVAPLQQYLVELPGGRLQALAVTWDTRPREQGGQRWFRQYPNEDIDHADELHWTRRAQNWNYMCADCHSTQVRKGYDATSDSFNTTFAEISVGCEACHGPGAAHVRWASSKERGEYVGLTVRFDERKGVTWPRDAAGKPVRSTQRATEREIEVCAQCHARRAQIAEGYVPGRPFMDHYLPSLLTPTLYHADGQQQDEVFIWGSWLQSRMHAAGVTCSDCHDPHTQKLRAPGNAVCAQCHEPAKYDVAAHHHHQAETAGAQCANCHMPQNTYMVIDPRRDHSMRVPRPDESVQLGVPNACNSCHTDRDARWAAKAVRGWLGRDAAGYQTFAAAFHDAEAGQPAALQRLGAIAADTAQPPIVRASALARLAGSGHFTRDFAQSTAQDPSPLVRLATVQLADVMPPEIRPDVVGPLLNDPTRAVRIEAARSLAGAHSRLPQELLPRWQQAAQEYVATLEYTADRPESRVALGGFKAALGEPDAAQRLFAEAIRMDPEFVPAYVNAADLLRTQGRDTEAAELLQQGLQRVPMSATLHHALGLARVRLQQPALALGSLKRAVELDPGTPRYTYVYAVALHSGGAVHEAIGRLQEALRRWPYDRDLLMALTSFQLESGRRQDAQATARKLVAAYPEDPQVAVLAAQALGDAAR
ncbi:MAG: multiheme c-type cytochrome [Gammaproteobacteria bacterium]|nr:multiheme c-type cytochrome [Gammaproteobacteria bacterium]MDH5227037.1 multiheme c-type cytochrome [Gammaproteobacteria bacterium]